MQILKVEITDYISLSGTMSLRDELVENERAESDLHFRHFSNFDIWPVQILNQPANLHTLLKYYFYKILK